MDCEISVCVITMNRSGQLLEALESCLNCRLPAKTEFIIIDNASTDDTEQVVKERMPDCGYPYYYEKLPENLGVGGGRNYAFSKARGKYVYVLDDDAAIDAEKNPDFFEKALKIMDTHPEIITLTTQIYDTRWKANRMTGGGPELEKGIYSCGMFCGGSHFLRRCFFQNAPYLSNRYGYEEIPPSLQVMDAGKFNVFCPELLVVHKPAVNKWDWTEEKNQQLLITGIASRYAILKRMYPGCCLPLLWLAAQVRFFRSLRKLPDAGNRYHRAVREICAECVFPERIRFRTVWKMFLQFGLSAF